MMTPFPIMVAMEMRIRRDQYQIIGGSGRKHVRACSVVFSDSIVAGFFIPSFEPVN